MMLMPKFMVGLFLFFSASISLFALDEVNEFKNFIRVRPWVKHHSQKDFLPLENSQHSNLIANEMSEHGCGLCCLAMIINQYKEAHNEKGRFELSFQSRHWDLPSFSLSPLKSVDLKERFTGKVCYRHLSKLNFEEIKEYIRKNTPIHISVVWAPEFKTSHGMIVAGYFESQRMQLVLLHDPLRKHAVAISFENLCSGHYHEKLPEEELILAMDDEISYEWWDSQALTDEACGVYGDKENREPNIQRNPSKKPSRARSKALQDLSNRNKP